MGYFTGKAFGLKSSQEDRKELAEFQVSLTEDVSITTFNHIDEEKSSRAQ